ncbi:hypothetical protein B0T13DRAFT_460059 [Neurospora crassa]|nr:hypothetical protein B0T13DRAFT_460059 [Neurospora crassa]
MFTIMSQIDSPFPPTFPVAVTPRDQPDAGADVKGIMLLLARARLARKLNRLTTSAPLPPPTGSPLSSRPSMAPRSSSLGPMAC